MTKKSKNQKIQKSKRVVVAMSGGVDSSVAAALLKKQGYEVIGVFMQFWFPVAAKYGENRCCSLESWQEAREVARILQIPIYKVNFGRPFKKMIVDDFLRQYQNGATPNPCVTCNKFIKFGLLLKCARTVFGADYLATGHYVKKLKVKSQKSKVCQYEVLKAIDKNKDQSYFLYNLTQPQLKHIFFPLGDYTKGEVRGLAKKLKLPVYGKKDSQEICFVGQSHYDFLKRYLKLKPGKIVARISSPGLNKRSRAGSKNFYLRPPLNPSLKQGGEKYKVLGVHQGLPLYTLGQRSGLKLSNGPWYVAGADRKKNLLIVTRDKKDELIWRKELKCGKINWVGKPPKRPLECEAQIRYHAKPAKCVVSELPPRPEGRQRTIASRAITNQLMVNFIKHQRAITPGQSVVFYQKGRLLGGGVITS